MTTATRWRWFQFRLRTLLVVVTLLSVGLGFYFNSFRQRRAAVAAIEGLGGVMGIRYMGPEWLRSRVKDEKHFWDPAGVHFSSSEHQLSDAEVQSLMPYLRKFQRLRDLSLRGPKITSNAIPLLIPLANKLVYLDLSESTISKGAIVYLQQFPKLRTLRLANTPLTPADIVEFKEALPSCKIEVQ
jgi:hypothetical protein